MEKFVILGTLTGEGTKKMSESPERLDRVKQMTSDLGGEFIDYYLTMGQYDFVYVCSMPDDNAMAQLLLEYGRGGAGKTETLRAFDETEYREIVSALGD